MDSAGRRRDLSGDAVVLTDRETELVRLVADGLMNDEIGPRSASRPRPSSRRSGGLPADVDPRAHRSGSPGRAWGLARRAERDPSRSGRCGASSTPSRNLGAGEGCRGATRARPPLLGPAWKSQPSATCSGS